MNTELRNKIQALSTRGIKILNEYLDNKPIGADMVKEASKMINFGIKIEHMNQLKNQNDRSFGLRLLQYLPKDDATREKYIELTAPALKTWLLSKPSKEKLVTKEEKCKHDLTPSTCVFCLEAAGGQKES